LGGKKERKMRKFQSDFLKILAVLEFELKTLNLLGKFSTILSHALIPRVMLKTQQLVLDTLGHGYNLSYLGGGVDQQDHSLRQAKGKTLVRPHLNK
jgi:hypothetical protein